MLSYHLCSSKAPRGTSPHATYMKVFEELLIWFVFKFFRVGDVHPRSFCAVSLSPPHALPSLAYSRFQKGVKKRSPLSSLNSTSTNPWIPPGISCQQVAWLQTRKRTCICLGSSAENWVGSAPAEPKSWGVNYPLLGILGLDIQKFYSLKTD
jgi:hypothetical protein